MSPEEDGEPWEPVVMYEANGQRYLHVSLRAVRQRTESAADRA
jgi:hypothetical protein